MNRLRTGVLLVNLGTPDSPDPKDVYRYLIEFLTDGRVIDTPYLLRQFLVRGLIVPRRYKQSARSYKEIWTDEGSPLKVYGERVTQLLQESLGDRYCVELAMRYQNPSIPSALERLRDQAVSDLIILPLFPQYASASTGSVQARVMKELSGWQGVPKTTFIESYPTQPKMIDAFCARANERDVGDYDHVLFSFHGLPQRHLRKLDRHNHCLNKPGCCETLSEKNQRCYSAQCYATAYAIAEKLGLSSERYSISFQSRLGRDPWIKPYTDHVISELAKKGMKQVLVLCPAFVADCLETVFEIGVEAEEIFQEAGGEVIDLVTGLNDHPMWVEALSEMVLENSQKPSLAVVEN